MAQEANRQDRDHGNQSGASGQPVESVDQVKRIGNEQDPEYGEQEIDGGADGMSGGDERKMVPK